MLNKLSYNLALIFCRQSFRNKNYEKNIDKNIEKQN